MRIRTSEEAEVMNDRARFVRIITASLLLAMATWVLSSCAKKESSESTATSSMPADSGMSSKPPAPTVSDANIAAIVVAANTADIDNGKQAQLKSKDAMVKAFAKQMIADHSSTNDKAVALAKKLNLTPEDNDTSRGIKAGQDSIRTALKAMSGSAFNKAYIDNEVSYHQTVLNAIDTVLIPNAQNAELKQLLTDVRPVIAEHLDHAKLIQTKIGGTPTP
jgi:putative membrane protein